MERADRKSSRPSHVLVAGGLALAAAAFPGTSAATPEGAVALASAKQEGEAFAAEIKPTGAYKAGKEGFVEVTLVPKGAYKINKQYPYKFKLPETPAEGLSFPTPVLKKDAFAIEDKKASVKIPFVAAKPGKAKVGGTFSLSVCSDANCLMEKVELEVEVDVK